MSIVLLDFHFGCILNIYVHWWMFLVIVVTVGELTAVCFCMIFPFLNWLYCINCFTLVCYVTLCLLYAFLCTVLLFMLCAYSSVTLDTANDESIPGFAPTAATIAS